MNTAWIDSSSTGLPPGDSSTDEAESPIVRLVRAQQRPQPISKSASLAAEDQPGTLPVAVLTNDPAFADQIRIALDGEASVTAISTVDEAAALAASGRCPILVTDTTITRHALDTLTQRLRAHDPATAIVVSGNRDQGGMFIGLQSSGAVDAFLLKPITTAATRLVIEAATRRYRCGATIESKRKPPIVAEHTMAPTVSMPAETPSRQRPRPSWSLVAIVAGAVAAVVAWETSQRPSGIDPNEIIAKHLALAETAFAAKRLLDARDGAAHHYRTVLEVDPQNFAAHRGLDAIARELSKQTQTYMSQQRLADAAISLERLRQLQPSYAELPLLDSQLRALQDRLVAAHTTARAMLAPALPEREPEAPKARPAPRSESRRSPTRNVASIPKPIEAPALPKASLPTIAEPPRDEPQVPISRSADSLLASIAPLRIRSEIAPDTTPAAAPAIAQAQPQTASEPAKLIRYVPPEYPSEAYVRRMEGWIEISMEVAPNGDVIAPRIEAGEKRQLFGRPALVAVRQWKYAPDATRAAGERSSVRLEFRME